MDFCHQQCGRQVPRGSGHLETKMAPTPQCWAPNAQWPWVRRTLAQSLHGPPVSAWPRSGCTCSPCAEIEVGGCPGTQTEWKDPASPWGVPSARPPEEEHAAPAHSLLGGCPGAERGRAPRGWPPGDTGAAGARCTHLASLLSRRAFFARVPLSGERRPALARGQNRPPDAHPPSSLRSENGSWGSSRLLPPHENKMGRAGDARQLSRLGQAQTGGLIHPLVPDPQLLHLKSGNNARPGQWPELPMEGGGGGGPGTTVSQCHPAQLWASGDSDGKAFAPGAPA